MACYHFTMKLDRKPDKSPVAAALHLEYIHRTGKFKNIDFRRAIELQKFSGNMICPPKREDSEAVRKLYQSVYGSLMDNGIGIEASDGASIETLQIALSLGMKKYGSVLDVQGSVDYKAKVLVAASEMDLPVTFTDETMNHEYLKLRERTENGRSGARKSRAEREQRAGVRIPCLEPIGKKGTSRRSHSLQILSKCGVDAKQERGHGMLLSGNDAIGLEYGQENGHRALRRNLSRGIRIKAERTADEILRRNNGDIPAASHVDYINRQENYAARGGCIYTSHHLPKWADDSPRKFFHAADQYERANGTRYREIEFALPNELSLEQQREIIDTFIDHHLKDFYYAYAVHDKIGAMSNGERNAHVHIMFSERKIDEYEKNHERLPEHFFKQANSKMPERGGCRKDEKWNGRDRVEYLCRMREDFARIQNDILAKYGMEDRVDHRSLREQYREAVKNGNLQLARQLDRLPEPHIGPLSASTQKGKKVADLMAYRAYKLEKSLLIQTANRLENEMDEEALRQEDEGIRQDMSKVEASEKFNLSSIGDLKNRVLDGIREIAALEKIIIWQQEADRMAREKYMTIEERIDCRELRKMINERAELAGLRKSLMEVPEATTPESEGTHDIMLANIASEMEKLDASIDRLKPKVRLIDKRLSTPQIMSLLQKESARIMHNDFPQKQRLKELQKEVRSLMPKLQEAVLSAIEQDALRIIRESEEKTRFTAKEIDAYLKQSYIVHSKDYKKQQQQADMLSQKVISLERATVMARDVYTKGAFKAIRGEKRRLEKERVRLEAFRGKFEKEESEFSLIPKPKWYQDGTAYHRQEESLSIQKQELLRGENAWKEKFASCQNREKELEAVCKKPDAREKIASITQGILRKNKVARDSYLAAKQRAGELYGKVRKIQDLQKGIRRQMEIDGKKGISYTLKSASGVTSSEGKADRLGFGENRILSIAQAIDSRRKAVGGSVVIRLDAEDEELDFDAIDVTDREAEMEKSERLLR